MAKHEPWVEHPILWLKGSIGVGNVEGVGVLRVAQDDGKGKGTATTDADSFCNDKQKQG
jgi:hypothetical protein